MRKPHTNDTTRPIYVGGVLIPAGETRTVDVHEPAVIEPAAPVDPEAGIKALSAGKAAAIIAAIPGLSVPDLSALLSLEDAREKPRTTVVSALQSEILERGKASPPAADDETVTLAELPDDELANLLEKLKAGAPADRSMIDAIELELMARADAREQGGDLG